MKNRNVELHCRVDCFSFLAKMPNISGLVWGRVDYLANRVEASVGQPVTRQSWRWSRNALAQFLDFQAVHGVSMQDHWFPGFGI